MRADGVVRIANHGTDHAAEGGGGTDAPLYARLGYSTATFPAGHDNAITLVRDGLRSHRSGFRVLACTPAVAASRARTHWVTGADGASPDHGAGRTGEVVPGPAVTMASLVRGPVEVRLAVLDDTTGLTGDTVLEFGGWPTTGLTSIVAPLAGFDAPVEGRETSASPLADQVSVPLLRTASAPRADRVYAAAVVLCAGEAPALPAVRCAGRTVAVTWPGGERCVLDLALPGTAPTR